MHDRVNAFVGKRVRIVLVGGLTLVGHLERALAPSFFEADGQRFQARDIVSIETISVERGSN
ncbi:MAG: hypothetical protein JO092_03370 [Candidatus Eremiobacteraeota bacterium]|nr:hypothetical protein [Candidatus Eremiobacteraeota bacterium]